MISSPLTKRSRSSGDRVTVDQISRRWKRPIRQQHEHQLIPSPICFRRRSNGNRNDAAALVQNDFETMSVIRYFVCWRLDMTNLERDSHRDSQSGMPSPMEILEGALNDGCEISSEIFWSVTLQSDIEIISLNLY